MVKASEDGFQKLKSVCATEQTQYAATYPNIVLISDEFLAWDSLPKVHDYSVSIMPDDVDDDVTPVESNADGNCLFRY